MISDWKARATSRSARTDLSLSKPILVDAFNQDPDEALELCFVYRTVCAGHRQPSSGFFVQGPSSGMQLPRNLANRTWVYLNDRWQTVLVKPRFQGGLDGGSNRERAHAIELDTCGRNGLRTCPSYTVVDVESCR